MADYRLDCCGGFPSHRAGCEAIVRERESRERRREERLLEERRWDEFFSSMTEDQLFQYTALCQKEMDRVVRFRNRRDKALDYMRRKGIAFKYSAWRRNV